MVICLERGADLQMTQLMPLPLTVCCFSKIQIGFTFLVPAHAGSPGKRAVKRARVRLSAFFSRTCVRACVCVYLTCFHRVSQPAVLILVRCRCYICGRVMQYSLWLWLASVLWYRDTGYSHLEHCTVHESWLQSCCLTGALVLWTYMLRNSFYPCDTLLARVLAMSPFLCLCLTFSTYPTVCYKEILVSRKGFFPLELFPKLRTLQNFTTAYPLLKGVMN